jgi:hypothetical protein
MRLSKISILWASFSFFLAGIALLNLEFPFGYLFESSWSDYKKWFPSFYWIIYLFSKLFFPIVYGIIVYKTTSSWNFKMANSKLFVFVQFFLLQFIQYFGGFKLLLVYGAFLMVLILCIISIKMALNNPISNTWKEKIKPLVLGSFLGLIYMVLCLILPPFHPFSRYSMFNRFSDSTSVYSLRDQKGKLIPLEKYSRLKNDDLYVYYRSLSKGNETSQDLNFKNPEKANGVSLIKLFLESATENPLPFDSIALYKTTIRRNHGRIEFTERLIVRYGTN